MKKDNLLPIYLFTIGVIGVVLLLFSCNAVKKVNKSEDKQLKVISNYIKKHPVKNDTLLVYRPGDTIIQEVERLDTITTSEIIKDTIRLKENIVRTVTITKTIRDTIEKRIVDRSIEIALQKELSTTYAVLQEYKINIAELKHKLDIWRLRFFALLLVNTIFIAFRIRKLFI